MAEYGYYCGDSRYRDVDVRRDAAMPSGFAPEEEFPVAFRRAERLRGREVGYQLAEVLLVHRAPVSAAASLMEVPYHVPPQRRAPWRTPEEGPPPGRGPCGRADAGPWPAPSP